jgi:hypothetical protein
MPAQIAYQDSSYALGITVNKRNEARHFQHGGGGWGFNSSMVWYPELKLGAVVLCNADLDNDLVVQLNEGILDDIITSAPDLYNQRTKNAGQVEPAFPPDEDEYVLPDTALQNLIVRKALSEDDSTENRRKALAGTYMVTELDGTVDFSVLNGDLTYSYQGIRNTLTELEPGLFFSPYGDAVDFRGQIPTFGNIPLIKIDTRSGQFQIAFYAICGWVFLSALFLSPLRALLRRIRRKSASVDRATILSPRSPWLVWMNILAGIASLFSLLILALIALVPNMVYILATMPLMRPYVDLLWWQFVILSLPFLSLVLSIVIVLLDGLTARGGTARRATHLYYLFVALALLTFNLAIIL